jgi:hypothetical protein
VSVLSFGEVLTTTVPSAAITRPTTFSYVAIETPTPPIPTDRQFANRAFFLAAEGVVTFTPSITLTVHFASGSVNTDTVVLYYRDTSQSPAEWRDVAGTCAPMTSTYRYTADYLEVAICHFTEFALFDLLSGNDVFLPVILKNQ